MKIFINFLVILLINYVTSIRIEKNQDPIVNLPNLGKLRGRTIETAWTRRTVYQFLDVKYAQSPGGENRFRPPIPIEAWDGIRDARSDGYSCPSVFALREFRLILSKKFLDFEDCLSMTITTPNLTGHYPVLVYLHGEFLYEGNNLEGSPEYMLEKDIVVVSPQYRLGPFGFLSTKTEDLPGNMGVLDVIMALHWIKYFIIDFGGDPDRITLMGQVGGAAIAHLLTLSPIVNNDLFHQVILQSGSALMPIFLTEEPEKYAKDIGGKSGCEQDDLNELNNCLRNLTVVELLEGFASHISEYSPMGANAVGGVQFTIGGPSPILPIHPLLITNTHRNHSYPMMGGSPKNVGTRALKGIIRTMLKKYIYETDFESVIPDNILKGVDYITHVLYQTQGFDETGVLTTMLIDKFFTPELINNGTFLVLLSGLIDLTGMIVHKIPTLLALNRNAKLKSNQTYLYSFGYRGQYNRYPDFDDDFDYGTPFSAGVTLTDENIYLFPYPTHVDHLNVIDELMAKKMIELWTSFIIKGKPTTGDPKFVWPSMQHSSNGPYLKIDGYDMMKIDKNYHDEFMATIHDEKFNGVSLVRQDFVNRQMDYLRKIWKKKLFKNKSKIQN